MGMTSMPSSGGMEPSERTGGHAKSDAFFCKAGSTTATLLSGTRLAAAAACASRCSNVARPS